MIDIIFIEFYLRKKYSQRTEEYFGVTSKIASHWRNKSFPEKRIHEFCYREGSSNILELFSFIYFVK